MPINLVSNEEPPLFLFSHSSNTRKISVNTTSLVPRSSIDLDPSEIENQLHFSIQDKYDSKYKKLEDDASLLPHNTALEDFKDLLVAVLTEQRYRCDRPEDLNHMNHEQILKEKLDLQKGLLYFEKLYGHPVTVEAKKAMRPLYNRYRVVKQMAKYPELKQNKSDLSVNCSTDLISIDILSGDGNDSKISNIQEIKNKASCSSLSSTEEKLSNYASGLLELSLDHLKEEKNTILKAKISLQRILRQFEANIQELEGRRPDKSERDQMRTQYNQYRELKQRLAVLDSLINSTPYELAQLNHDKKATIIALLIAAQLSPPKTRQLKCNSDGNSTQHSESRFMKNDSRKSPRQSTILAQTKTTHS